MLNVNEFTERATTNEFVNEAICRCVSQHVANAKHHVGASSAHARNGFAIGQSHRHGLFKQNMVPTLCTRNSDGLVCLVRCSHHDHIGHAINTFIRRAEKSLDSCEEARCGDIVQALKGQKE